MATVAALKGELEQLTANLRTGRSLPITPLRFAELAAFSSSVSVHQTKLPASIAGNNEMFPNQPVPGWEAEVRAATKAGFDDLQGGSVGVESELGKGSRFWARLPRGALDGG